MNITSIHAAAATEMGSRSGNQDNLTLPYQCCLPPNVKSYRFTAHDLAPEGFFAALFDGCGGEHHGDLAALEAARGFFRAAWRQPGQSPQELLPRAVIAADHAVADLNDDLQDYYFPESTACCTLAAAMVTAEGVAYIANLGDSPIFIISNEGTVTELSVRHNEYYAALRAGEQPVPAMKRSLTGALGAPEDYLRDAIQDEALRSVEGRAAAVRGAAHFAEARLNPGDRLLLCSDGITDAFPTSEELGKALLTHGAEKLAALAAAVTERRGLLRRPNADNCTLIELTFEEAPAEATEGKE